MPKAQNVQRTKCPRAKMPNGQNNLPFVRKGFGFVFKVGSLRNLLEKL